MRVSYSEHYVGSVAVTSQDKAKHGLAGWTECLPNPAYMDIQVQNRVYQLIKRGTAADLR